MTLDATLTTLRGAQRAWATRSLDDRCEAVRALGEHFARRAEEVAATVVAETQKDPVDAWFSDVVPNLSLFSYWTGAGAKALDPEPAPISQLEFPKKKGYIAYEPVGIVGLITPWNYPAALALRTLVPALVAGNGVLMKPSEVTPRTGRLLAEIFASGALPTGLVAVVDGAAEAGEAVIDASDHVVFIGSVATGRKVAARAAAQLKSVSLELGGKDAAIVLADCDFDRTVAGVFWGAMANSGQNCAAIERCFVETSIYPRFVAALADLARTTPIAPVATPAQDAVVRRHLDDAKARGAKLHGTYPGAVILEDVPADALIATEETFGPVLPVWSVASSEVALERANASVYGLGTSFWTRDTARAEALAKRATTGVVAINNVACTAAMPFAPWSGRRLSGHGVTNSHLALRELSRPKFVLVDKNAVPEVWWHPFDEQAVALARQSLGWLAATGMDKLGRTLSLLSAMKKRTAAQVAWGKKPRS
jgi:acyl-CoA reductase-like NAD-dependent aldehyde dehydrogenase